jgi:hypothetical protein
VGNGNASLCEQRESKSPSIFADGGQGGINPFARTRRDNRPAGGNFLTMEKSIGTGRARHNRVGKMPRKQTNVIPPDPNANRLRPPDNLPPPERAVFVEMVTGNPPSHFRASDLRLLVQYCCAVVLNERACAELRAEPIRDNKSSPWLNVFEKTGRAMMALSMRLRLSPQARLPKTINHKGPRPSYYDLMQLENNEDEEEQPR